MKYAMDKEQVQASRSYAGDLLKESFKGLERSGVEERASAYRFVQAQLLRKHWDIMDDASKKRAIEVLIFLENDGQGIFSLNLKYMTWHDYQLVQERHHEKQKE